MKRISTAYSRI